jgi:hypothetical protein
MENKTAETQKDILRRLFIANNLVKEDVFKHKFYTIITRQGIDKIMAANKIQIKYVTEKISDDHKYVIMKGFGKMGDEIIEDYGESSPANNSNAYPVAMAMKRAKSRIVLSLAGFYAQGFFGEDESDDFKRR